MRGLGSVGVKGQRVEIVAWYRCVCGFIMEATPQLGDSIVSVSHLHPAARLDGASSIVRMEEIRDPVLDCEIACAVGSPDAHPAPSSAGLGDQIRATAVRISSPISAVVELPPRSGVSRSPLRRVSVTAVSTVRAASKSLG